MLQLVDRRKKQFFLCRLKDPRPTIDRVIHIFETGIADSHIGADAFKTANKAKSLSLTPEVLLLRQFDGELAVPTSLCCQPETALRIQKVWGTSHQKSGGLADELHEISR
ncbi:hypothetical protein XAUC_39920 [Xanthomonas citri pv. aurantifolii str. ICPB 10535]|nr:hypothetical protein XAUC_39920 [Xanthomonas citri pv. aurantifolii str. ICPB 10535]